MDEGAWESYLSQWRGEEGRLAFLRKEPGLRERDTAELGARLGEVAVPVLVAWGEEDAWLDSSQADRLHEAIPNSILWKMSGAGHFLPEDAPTEAGNVLARFLADEPLPEEGGTA